MKFRFDVYNINWAGAFPLMIGLTIKNWYEITELLGHGGQGSIYKAGDQRLRVKFVKSS